MIRKITKRVTEYFEDPLNGEVITENFPDSGGIKEAYTDPRSDEPKQVTDTFSEDEKKEMREHPSVVSVGEKRYASCACEADKKKMFEGFVAQKIKVLLKGHESQSVNLLMGQPTVTNGDGKKIKGTLAYAGVSLNNRLYLPEELAKGDGMTVPLIINHASTAGAEQEIYSERRVPQDVVDKLERGVEHVVGSITLNWNPDDNTLYYEGEITDPFWQKEVEDADMAVSLGLYYDNDSPTICNTNCYTVIRGAEFHEVSLVYHPGFPIATIEAVEVILKKKAIEVLSKASEIIYQKYTDFTEELIKISFEAIGPHSREYDYIINEPTSTPEISSSNSKAGKFEDPETRLARSRMNMNMLPTEELDDVKWGDPPKTGNESKFKDLKNIVFSS